MLSSCCGRRRCFFCISLLPLLPLRRNLLRNLLRLRCRRNNSLLRLPPCLALQLLRSPESSGRKTLVLFFFRFYSSSSQFERYRHLERLLLLMKMKMLKVALLFVLLLGSARGESSKVDARTFLPGENLGIFIIIRVMHNKQEH